MRSAQLEYMRMGCVCAGKGCQLVDRKKTTAWEQRGSREISRFAGNSVLIEGIEIFIELITVLVAVSISCSALVAKL